MLSQRSPKRKEAPELVEESEPAAGLDQPDANWLVWMMTEKIKPLPSGSIHPNVLSSPNVPFRPNPGVITRRVQADAAVLFNIVLPVKVWEHIAPATSSAIAAKNLLRSTSSPLRNFEGSEVSADDIEDMFGIRLALYANRSNASLKEQFESNKK